MLTYAVRCQSIKQTFQQFWPNIIQMHIWCRILYKIIFLYYIVNILCRVEYQKHQLNHRWNQINRICRWCEKFRAHTCIEIQTYLVYTRIYCKQWNMILHFILHQFYANYLALAWTNVNANIYLTLSVWYCLLISICLKIALVEMEETLVFDFFPKFLFKCIHVSQFWPKKFNLHLIYYSSLNKYQKSAFDACTLYLRISLNHSILLWSKSIMKLKLFFIRFLCKINYNIFAIHLF